MPTNQTATFTVLKAFADYAKGDTGSAPLSQVHGWARRGRVRIEDVSENGPADDGAAKEAREPDEGAVAENAESEIASVEDYHTGGGWYELPSGERVRGKDAAREALADDDSDEEDAAS